MPNSGLSLTIGIPTCSGGTSLLAAAKSIVESAASYGPFRFLIVADRNPIPSPVLAQLKDLGVTVHWNRNQGSQMHKLRQILELVDSDVFLFTQDDVLFEPQTVSEVMRAFREDPLVSAVGCHILPLPPQTAVETGMASMVRMVDRMGQLWNRGDNHLLANGRCMAFRTEMFKRISQPEAMINGDMFWYLENKRLGGRFRYLPEARAYIRCPQTVRDPLGPSSRYQYSQKELSRYYEYDISHEYRIPLRVMMAAALSELLRHPLSTITYASIFAYTRLRRQPPAVALNPLWRVDVSTKRLQ